MTAKQSSAYNKINSVFEIHFTKSRFKKGTK
jgi:hypothetical protein